MSTCYLLLLDFPHLRAQKRLARQLHPNWERDMYTCCILWKASFRQLRRHVWVLSFSGGWTDLTRPFRSICIQRRKMFAWSGGQEGGLGQLQWEERIKGSIIGHGDGSNMDSCWEMSFGIFAYIWVESKFSRFWRISPSCCFPVINWFPEQGIAVWCAFVIYLATRFVAIGQAKFHESQHDALDTLAKALDGGIVWGSCINCAKRFQNLNAAICFNWSCHVCLKLSVFKLFCIWMKLLLDCCCCFSISPFIYIHSTSRQPQSIK